MITTHVLGVEMKAPFYTLMILKRYPHYRC